VETKIIISFDLKITEVFGDGFQGVDIEDTSFFKSKSMIKDKIALKNNSHTIGEIVTIRVETIEENEIRKDRSSEFYCVVNELTNNGFYTKHYKEYENIFKRAWMYEARGMITFTKEEHANRFDVGDILKVTIR